MFRVYLERPLCSPAVVEREEARSCPFWRLCNRERHSWAQEKEEVLSTGVGGETWKWEVRWGAGEVKAFVFLRMSACSG